MHYNIFRLALIGVSFAIVLLLVVNLWVAGIARKRKAGQGRIWKWIEKHLTAIFVVVWLYSFLTYFVGTYVGGTDWKGSLWAALSVLPMSVIHATESFLGMSDISAIHQDRHDNWLFMVFFDTSHLLAVTVSLCFVLKHLGYYAISKYRFWMERRSGGRYKEIFVFWGVNEATYSLAKSIIAHYGDNPAYLVIFVKMPMEENDNNQRIGFDRFLNFVTMKEVEMRRLDGLDRTVIVSSYHKLSTTQLPDGDSFAPVLTDNLGLKSLATILTRDEGRVHVFFFDASQNANINATANIIRDETLRSKNLHVYCLARRGFKTAWMEHYSILHQDKHTVIHVVDRPELSVYQLESDVECHPVNFVSWNYHTAIPATTFSSLVIGFHETGLEALEFLYEFGTFTDGNGDRIPGEYIAVDRDMDSLAGEFYARRPGLGKDSGISLKKCAVGDDNYWKLVQDILPRLNYVVIALGDDELGMDTAVTLCRMAYNDVRRDDSERLTVFVRSYDTNNLKRISQVKDDINRLCGGNIRIEIFGTTSQIFTYDLLVNDRIIKEAKVYNYFYENIKNSPSLPVSDDVLEETWNSVLGISKKPSDDMTLADILDIERKRDQNVSDSLHSATKLRILKACGIESPGDDVKWQLAKLEHERWVAYSVLHGWRRMPAEYARKTGSTRDTAHKLHTDICKWDDIRSWSAKEQRDTQEYDLRVVETSLLLATSKNKK